MSLGARSTDQDLGDILLAAHIIDEAALAKVRREFQRTNRPLWRLVTRDGLVSDDALFKALRQEVRVPVLAADQLKSVVMPEELRNALPHNVAQHLGILPLERSTDGRRAVLAMADPTSDITPIWPALTKLGVIEVRRFLVHLGTLRLGLEFFYGLPWRPEPADPGEEAAVVQGVQATLERSAITQPIRVSLEPSQKSASSSVMVDPRLQIELEQMDGPTDPSARQQPSRAAPAPVPAASPIRRTAEPAQAPYRVRPETSLPELSASDLMMVVDEQLPRDSSSARVIEGEPVQDAFMKASEALLAAFEAELRVSRPQAFAKLAQAVAERLGFAPRAVSELMLVSKLYGLLRLLLGRDGPLPAPGKDLLGFDSQHPLMKALRELQSVLVDFIRLPTEPDIVPMGARIVETVTAALDLIEQGLQGEELASRLRQRAEDSQVTEALVQIVETDLQALGIEPGKPEAAATASDGVAQPVPEPAAAPAPSSVSAPVAAAAPAVDLTPPPPVILLLAPRPPIMPDVRWRTGPAASLSDEGLEPYEPPNTAFATTERDSWTAP